MSWWKTAAAGDERLEALASRARIALPSAAAASPAAVGPAAVRASSAGVTSIGSDHAGLTPREREVLELIAAGRTNRQIADALFITEKTAGTHVSNILAKLNANGRTEAAAIARQRGLLGQP